MLCRRLVALASCASWNVSGLKVPLHIWPVKRVAQCFVRLIRAEVFQDIMRETKDGFAEMGYIGDHQMFPYEPEFFPLLDDTHPRGSSMECFDPRVQVVAFLH